MFNPQTYDFKYKLTLVFLITLLFDFQEAYLIGERCKYDDDCFVDNSYCEMQQICECKENFIVSEDGESCTALVGAHCHSKYDCASLPNSICKDDRCVCDQGYVPDTHQSKCLQTIQQIKDECVSDLQCTGRLGKEGHCFQGHCHCLPGYHFENYCIPSKRLQHQCSNSSQCFIGEDYRNTIVCSNGYCKCATGYHEDLNICLLDRNCSNKIGGVLTVITINILMIFGVQKYINLSTYN